MGHDPQCSRLHSSWPDIQWSSTLPPPHTHTITSLPFKWFSAKWAPDGSGMQMVNSPRSTPLPCGSTCKNPLKGAHPLNGFYKWAPGTPCHCLQNPLKRTAPFKLFLQAGAVLEWGANDKSLLALQIYAVPAVKTHLKGMSPANPNQLVNWEEVQPSLSFLVWAT